MMKLAPGSKLNEVKLAAEIGISRSPVKAAIERLCEDGLAEKILGKTSRVAPVDANDCMQLCEARKGIEGEAAFLAAKKISAEELVLLRKLYRKHELSFEKLDPMAFELDSQFHQAIINASHNKYLQETYGVMCNRITRYRQYVYKVMISSISGDFAYSQLRAHKATLIAIENGLSFVARDEITQDIEIMRSVVRFLT